MAQREVVGEREEGGGRRHLRPHLPPIFSGEGGTEDLVASLNQGLLFLFRKPPPPPPPPGESEQQFPAAAAAIGRENFSGFGGGRHFIA